MNGWWRFLAVRGLRVCLLALVLPAEGGDWPVYRGGPGLAGQVEARLPVPLERRWVVKAGGAVQSSPVVAGGRVFFGSDDGSLRAVALADGSNVWTTALGAAVEAAPLVVNGVVYVGAGEGLHAVDADTGIVRWTARTGGRIAGSANVVDDKKAGRTLIVVGSYDASLHALDAANGSNVWKVAAGGYINGTPAVAGGLVVFGGCDMALRVVEAGSGAVQTNYPLNSYMPGSPAVVDGKAYLGHFGNEFLCIDLEQGKVLWRVESEGAPVFSAPAVSSRRVLFGARDMKVHCINRFEGKEVWTFQAGADVDSSPVVAGDQVVFGSDDGWLYVVALEDGRKLWSYEIGAAIKTSPAVVDGMLLIGAGDGGVYAFGSARE